MNNLEGTYCQYVYRSRMRTDAALCHSSGLENFTRLKRLKLTFSDEDIRLISTVLDRVRSKRIKVLTLMLRADKQPRATTLQQLAELRLDAVLDEPWFRRLRSVLLCVETRVPRGEELDKVGWVADIKERLPGLQARGILKTVVYGSRYRHFYPS